MDERKASAPEARGAMFRQVGLALTILREMRGVSQAELARKAGIGKSQLSKYENGREQPKLDSLDKLLRALGGRPLTLFYLVQMLDRVAAEEPLDLLLVGSSFEPLITDEQEESFGRVVKELLGLFKAQIEGRVLGSRKRSSRDE